MVALAEAEPPRQSSPLPLAAIPSPVSVTWPGSGYGNKAYTGREWDPETSLYYYRARYYDPKIGRFISEDPIGLRGGDANFYAYVGNGPTVWRDPWGLWRTSEQAANAAAGQIVRQSDWTQREYHSYIYKDSKGEYQHTDLDSAASGVTKWTPPPFKGPGEEVGEIHNHFKVPGYDTSNFSPEDIARALACYYGNCKSVESYMLTPDYGMKRIDWRNFPVIQERDPITGCWK